jgi:aryl-alcohol dehydrogenase-like predicted oxidoreductase
VKYRALGRTGMNVSTLCLGTMVLGPWGNQDEDDCVRIINHALDAGINFFDTADVYGGGESERILGRALKGRRDSVVIGTKFRAKVGDDQTSMGASRRWIMLAVDNSLRRLGTDWIDVFYVHRPDLATDFAETISALSDLVRQGKIRTFGTSTFPVEQIVEGQWMADKRNYEFPSVEQPPYSIFVRGAETAILPTCQRYNLGVAVWSPLAGGWLTGRFRRGTQAPDRAGGEIDRRLPGRFDVSVPANQRKLDLIEPLLELAAECECDLASLATAWVLQHPAVTSAIIGPRTFEQLESTLAGQRKSLPGPVLDRIDELVAPGEDVNSADSGYTAPSLLTPWRRRRTR